MTLGFVVKKKMFFSLFVLDFLVSSVSTYALVCISCPLSDTRVTVSQCYCVWLVMWMTVSRLQTVALTWWSLFRDSLYYIFSVLALILVSVSVCERKRERKINVPAMKLNTSKAIQMLDYQMNSLLNKLMKSWFDIFSNNWCLLSLICCLYSFPELLL